MWCVCSPQIMFSVQQRQALGEGLTDGGGIRGYSSLLILQQLMREVAKWETRLEAEEVTDPSQRKTFDADKLLPCHYFDFMYGTSTGGLIGTMIPSLKVMCVSPGAMS